MVNIARRRLILASAAVLAGGRAWASEYGYRLGNGLPSTHPANARARLAASMIREDTNGSLDLEIVPENRLGSDAEMLAQLRGGTLELLLVSGSALSVLAPIAAIGGVGFAFADYAQVWRAMDGPLGERVRNALVPYGLVPFANPWDDGFRQITTSRHPIKGPGDLAGRAIGTGPSPLSASLFQALGATPRSLEPARAASALDMHVLDGAENPLFRIESQRLYEVQTYLSMTNHGWDGLWLVADARAWRALPGDVRDIVARRMAEAAIDLRNDLADLNGTDETVLARKGMVTNRPDPAPFRAALSRAGFYATWRGRLGADVWAALEGEVGILA